MRCDVSRRCVRYVFYLARLVHLVSHFTVSLPFIGLASFRLAIKSSLLSYLPFLFMFVIMCAVVHSHFFVRTLTLTLMQNANVNGMTLDWARAMCPFDKYLFLLCERYIYIFICLSGVFNHSKTLSLAQMELMSTWVERLLAGSFNRSLNRDNCRMNCDKHNTSLKLLINSKPLAVTRSQPASQPFLYQFDNELKIVNSSLFHAFSHLSSAKA